MTLFEKRYSDFLTAIEKIPRERQHALKGVFAYGAQKAIEIAQDAMEAGASGMQYIDELVKFMNIMEEWLKFDDPCLISQLPRNPFIDPLINMLEPPERERWISKKARKGMAETYRGGVISVFGPELQIDFDNINDQIRALKNKIANEALADASPLTKGILTDYLNNIEATH